MTEAKDTVIRGEDLCELVPLEQCRQFKGCEDCVLFTQAKVTFSAGMQEVIDWIKNNTTKETCEYDNHNLLQRFRVTDWQSFLKERGL